MPPLSPSALWTVLSAPGALAVGGVDLIEEAGVRLLQARRVQEHEGGQLMGGRRAKDGRRGVFFVEEGQPADVVDVGVGEDHRVQVPGREREAAVLVQGFLPMALEHAAVQ